MSDVGFLCILNCLICWRSQLFFKFFELFFQVFDLCDVGWELAQLDLLFVVVEKTHHWTSSIFTRRGNRFADTASCCDHGEVCDLDMSDDACLSSNNDISSRF